MGAQICNTWWNISAAGRKITEEITFSLIKLYNNTTSTIIIIHINASKHTFEF